MSTLKEKSQAILDEKNAKILPENIKKDVQIFDIVGTMESLDTSDATAEPNDIVNGKIAYVNGERVTGTVEEITDMIGQPADHIHITGNEPSSQINIRYNFPSDVLYRQDASLLLLTNNETLASAAELTPEKIVEGNTILGIDGNAKSAPEAQEYNDYYDTGVYSTATDGENYLTFDMPAGSFTEPVYLDETSNLTLSAKEQDVANAIELTAEKLVEGNTILGIDGTAKTELASVGTKLFETVEEMNSDETPQVDDLAIVYRKEIQNATVNSIFSKAKFPSTVVLPSALTDYVEVSYRAIDGSVMFDCWGSLDANNFMMDCYSSSGSVRVNYTSSDGITYTRTDGGDEIMDFGTEIYYAYPEMWNSYIGYFVQLESNYFGGLYQYLPYTKDMTVDIPYNFSLDGSDIKYDVISKNITNTYNKIKEIYSYEGGLTMLGTQYSNGEPTKILASNAGGSGFVKVDDKIYLAYTYSTTLPTTTKSYAYVYDLINNTYVYEPIDVINIKCGDNYYTVYTEYVIDSDEIFLGPIGMTQGEFNSGVDYIRIDNVSKSFSIEYSKFYKYQVAPNQLSLAESNELLPGIAAYGHNGLVTGDDSIYENLDTEKVMNKFFNLTSDNDYTHATTITHLGLYPTDTIDKTLHFLIPSVDGNVGIIDTAKIEYMTPRMYSTDKTKYILRKYESSNFNNLEIYNTENNTLVTTLNCCDSNVGSYYTNMFTLTRDYIAYIDTTYKVHIYNINTNVDKVVKTLSLTYSAIDTIEILTVDDNYVFVTFATSAYTNSQFKRQTYTGVYTISTETYAEVQNLDWSVSSNYNAYASAICNLPDKIYISCPYMSGQTILCNVLKLDKATDAITTVSTGTSISCHGGVYLTRSYEGFEDDNYIYFPHNTNYNGGYKRIDKNFTKAESIDLKDYISNGIASNFDADSVYKYDDKYYAELVLDGSNALCELSITASDTLSITATPIIYLTQTRSWKTVNDNTTYDFHYGHLYDRYTGMFMSKTGNVITFLATCSRSADNVTTFSGMKYDVVLYDVADTNTNIGILETSKSGSYDAIIILGNSDADILAE